MTKDPDMRESKTAPPKAERPIKEEQPYNCCKCSLGFADDMQGSAECQTAGSLKFIYS